MKKTYGKESDLNLKLVIGINRTHANLRRQENIAMRNAGLTYHQFAVLEALYHLGDLRVNEIIERTLSTGGNMTVVIKNLERDGFVNRYCNPEDKRSFIVQLTEKGLNTIRDAFTEHLKIINNTFDHMTNEEKETLSQLLKKFNGIDK